MICEERALASSKQKVHERYTRASKSSNSWFIFSIRVTEESSQNNTKFVHLNWLKYIYILYKKRYTGTAYEKGMGMPGMLSSDVCECRLPLERAPTNDHHHHQWILSVCDGVCRRLACVLGMMMQYIYTMSNTVRFKPQKGLSIKGSERALQATRYVQQWSI